MVFSSPWLPAAACPLRHWFALPFRGDFFVTVGAHWAVGKAYTAVLPLAVRLQRAFQHGEEGGPNACALCL